MKILVTGGSGLVGFAINDLVETFHQQKKN